MDFWIFTMVLMCVPIHPKVCGAYNETPSLVIYPWEKFCALLTINLWEQGLTRFHSLKWMDDIGNSLLHHMEWHFWLGQISHHFVLEQNLACFTWVIFQHAYFHFKYLAWRKWQFPNFQWPNGVCQCWVGSHFGG